MRAVIFAGPSLPPRTRPATGPFEWRPPVRQGELYRVALDRPAVIGVIDGYFETTPTVWHKEILWAMAHGIHVFGAASIGALRAAELDAFGMSGIGRVYDGFRSGALEDDDEVAVLHGPAEIGYPAVTDAMVDIRATLSAAVSEDVVSAGFAADLTAIAKALFYKERTYRALLDAAAAAGADSGALSRFEHWLTTGRVHQKQRDALAMVRAIATLLAAGVLPLQVDYELANTAAWQAAIRAATSLISADQDYR